MEQWPVTISLPQGFTIGGHSSWAFRLADALSARGRRVNLVGHAPFMGFREIPENELPSGADMRLIRAPSLEDHTNWQACISCYRELLPMIVLPGILSESFGIAASLAAVLPEEIRVVAWNHSDNPYDFAYLKWYEPIIHRYVVNTCRCEEEILRRVPTREDDVERFPHGVARETGIDRPPLDDRPLRLIYAGRMDHLVKRVLDLPKLARLLDARKVHFEMRLIGDGPQERELRAAIDETQGAFTDDRNVLRLDPPVSWQSIDSAWAWADVSLLLSAHEGMSVAMLEAMACGCVPVVSRVASGVSEVIDEGHNGISHPVGDLKGTADSIAGLARQPQRIHEMSCAARDTIGRKFAFDTYVNRVVANLDFASDSPPRAWPPERALTVAAAVPAGPPADDSIPSDCAERLRRLLNSSAEEQCGPIAIYGAGRHTRALASVWAESPVEIRLVIDDDPSRHGERLWGWPIVGPEQAHDHGISAAVISSWMHRAAMAETCHCVGLRALQIYGMASDTLQACVAVS